MSYAVLGLEDDNGLIRIGSRVMKLPGRDCEKHLDLAKCNKTILCGQEVLILCDKRAGVYKSCTISTLVIESDTKNEPSHEARSVAYSPQTAQTGTS